MCPKTMSNVTVATCLLQAGTPPSQVLTILTLSLTTTQMFKLYTYIVIPHCAVVLKEEISVKDPNRFFLFLNSTCCKVVYFSHKHNTHKHRVQWRLTQF